MYIPAQPMPAALNVGPQEKLISIAAGAALLVNGMRRPVSSTGLVQLALGALALHRGLTGHCMVKAMLDNEEHPDQGFPSSIYVEKSIRINRTPHELYTLWHDFENLPNIMSHLVRVTLKENNISHWEAKDPFGYTVEWDAELVHEIDNELISWRSLEGSTVQSIGSVRFADAGHGETDVQVTLKYMPPGGELGAGVARLLGRDPATTIACDLKRFKALMENAGEGPRPVPHAGKIDGLAHGTLTETHPTLGNPRAVEMSSGY